MPQSYRGTATMLAPTVVLAAILFAALSLYAPTSTCAVQPDPYATHAGRMFVLDTTDPTSICRYNSQRNPNNYTERMYTTYAR